MKILDRTKILVIGNHPIDSIPFEQRGLTLERIDIDRLNDTDLTNSARGILISLPAKKLSLIKYYFKHC